MGHTAPQKLESVGASAKVEATQLDSNPASSTGTGTLGKAMSVINIIASSSEPLRFTDVLARSDQPRGTLHRQIANLIEEGLISVNPDHSYSLGLTLLKYASKAWAGNRFRNIAEPHLQSLHAKTGETVHLGVLRGAEVIYLDKVEGTQSVRMHSQIGNVSPVYCTGVGKAAISKLDDSHIRARMREVEFHGFTETTHPDIDSLLEEISTIRREGVAYDREEHEVGICCVAAPIWSADGSFRAGVSVTGPAYRVTRSTLKSWKPLVIETARLIMDDMGNRLGPRA